MANCIKYFLIFFMINTFVACNNINSEKKHLRNFKCNEIVKKDTTLLKLLNSYKPMNKKFAFDTVIPFLTKYEQNCLLKSDTIRKLFINILKRHYFYLLSTGHKKSDFDVYNVNIWANSRSGRFMYNYLYSPNWFRVNSYERILNSWDDWVNADSLRLFFAVIKSNVILFRQ